MENDNLYIVLFFFRVKLQLVFEAGEMIRDIMKEDIDEQNKLDRVLKIIEGCGFNETVFKVNKDRVMEKLPYARELFDDYLEGEMRIKFMTEMVELDLTNGSILFEFVLN
jgi:hypothetical protein